LKSEPNKTKMVQKP